MTPQRIQRRRSKGWTMPAGAVYVGRPSLWGNPWPVDGPWMTWAAVGTGYRADPSGRRQAAVAFYRAWMTDGAIQPGPLAADGWGGDLEFTGGRVVSVAEHTQRLALGFAGLYDSPTVPDRPDLTPLGGRDLACWCPLDQPCHADVLIELANR